jgi:hypothetical protein
MSITMPIKIVQNFLWQQSTSGDMFAPTTIPKRLKEMVHLQVAWHPNIKCVINFNVYLQVCKSPWEIWIVCHLILTFMDGQIFQSLEWYNYQVNGNVEEGEKKKVKVRPTNLLVNDRSNDHPCILELLTCNSIIFPIFFYFAPLFF